MGGFELNNACLIYIVNPKYPENNSLFKPVENKIFIFSKDDIYGLVTRNEVLCFVNEQINLHRSSLIICHPLNSFYGDMLACILSIIFNKEDIRSRYGERMYETQFNEYLSYYTDTYNKLYGNK